MGADSSRSSAFRAEDVFLSNWLMHDSLRIFPWVALFQQLFPIPKPGRHLHWQREAELMRQHANLPAMVGFVRNHVAEHFRANRPRLSPAVSVKFLDSSIPAQRFSQHLRTARRAISQSRTGLLWRAA